MLSEKRLILTQFLEQRDWRGLQTWADKNKTAPRLIQTLLLSPNRRLLHRAAEAMGRMASVNYPDAPNKIKETLRRFFWGMNEESGNPIWGAPEAITEILLLIPDWIPLYGPQLASHYEIQPFERGVLWGVYRLCELNLDPFLSFSSSFKELTHSSDPGQRAFASAILKRLGTHPDRLFESRIHDNMSFEYYDWQTGEIQQITVAEFINKQGATK
jgi:AraC family transcriptional regulator, regulatory protein of adaptative response / methylated-DNA-[protein]-cysteine methyltransferase